MNQKEYSETDMDLCPHLRFVRGHAHRIVTSFARAPGQVRERAAIEASDLSHLLTQVIVPLARLAQGEQYAAEYERLASSLQALAAGTLTMDANYPDDGGKQFLRDRIDDLEVKLNQVLERAGRRTAAASCRKAVEIFNAARL